MRIIPAIDLIDGKCVRLTKGDYDTKKIYNENPLEVAKEFEAHGIQYLHVVDLDGAKASQIVNYKTLETLASKTNLQIDFGGGLKRDEDIRIAFESGASQITVGSVAVKKPELVENWLAKYGSEKIILGSDFKNGKIATQGWTESSDWELLDFLLSYQQKGMTHTICTDISKDGMLIGPSIEAYKEILEKTELKLIASGGVSTMDDLLELKEIGCEGAIFGKAIYEGKVTLKQIEELC